MQDDSDMDDEDDLLLASIAQLPEVFKSLSIFIASGSFSPFLNRICYRYASGSLYHELKKPESRIVLLCHLSYYFRNCFTYHFDLEGKNCCFCLFSWSMKNKYATFEMFPDKMVFNVITS
jgi:hypothetical protein